MFNTKRLVFLGDKNVGKTSLISRLRNCEPPKEHVDTLNILKSKKKIKIKGKKFRFYDTPGSSDIVNTYPPKFSKTTCFILIYDISEKTINIDNIIKWTNVIKKISKINKPGFILVGNKLDILQKRIQKKIQKKIHKKMGLGENIEKKKSEIIKKFETEGLNNNFEYDFCEISVKNKTNIEELIEKIFSLLVQIKISNKNYCFGA